MLQLSQDRVQDEYKARFVVTTVVVILAFGILFGRIWFLQILQGRKFQQFSEKNRITVKEIPALRGRILDRNGVLIADNRPSFDLLITPSRVQGSLRTTFDKVTDLLHWKDEQRETAWQKLRQSPRHNAFVAGSDLRRNEIARVLARQHALSGVQVVYAPARMYPYQTFSSHLLGYLGEISRSDWRKLRSDPDTPYRLGDKWGISGVEKAFEADLRGARGARPFIEDAWGRELGEEFSGELLPAFQRREARPGHDLVLSLDIRLQAAAEEAFKHALGAVVALDPQNGDVLALMSRPEYELERLVGRDRDQYWRQLVRDPQKPLYDRALRGHYPPGSTFKIVTATAALEAGIVTPDEKIVCRGSYKLGRERKRCWKRTGHGPMDFHHALKHSCDVYFYEMGHRLGINTLARYARQFGFGTKTGIGINREVDGLVPTEEWKKRVYGQPWVGGETLSVAIGQGALQITPLQMAVALAALVNGGVRFQPRVALRSQTIAGRVVQEFPVKERGRLPFAPDHMARVVRGLVGVVQEVGGTAYWSARSKLVKIGGKTGTAQVVGRHAKTKIEDHAWFIAFAPIVDPKIVVSVIVEYGGHGGATAGPIARHVIEAYLGETS